MIGRDVFESFLAAYNQGVFPAQIALYAIGIAAAVGLFWKPGTWTTVAAKAVLAALWTWCGVFFFYLYYSRVNSAGYIWGGVFVLQAVYFVVDIFLPRLNFVPYHHKNLGHVGAAMAGWSFIGYPILALVFGHGWPTLQLFGAAAPVVIFTCGLMMFTFNSKPRWRFLFIPVVWSFVGGLGSPRDWGHYQDYTLFAAGVTVLITWIWASHEYKEKKK